MKTIVIIFAFALCVAAELHQAQYLLLANREHKSSCANEHSISDRQAYYISVGKIQRGDMTENEKYYVTCMLRKSGAISEIGEVKKIGGNIPASRRDAAISFGESCRGDFSTDDSNSIFQLLDCINEKMKESGWSEIRIFFT